MFDLMNLENSVQLKCDVIGYQFPDSARDNWCLIKAVVKQGEEIFEVVDPALEATEIVTLYKWFKCLSSRELPRFACQSFTEPNLEFEFLACKEETVRIAIHLELEMKPEFKLKQFKSISKKWDVVFELTPDDFKSVLTGMEFAMEQFPIRES